MSCLCKFELLEERMKDMFDIFLISDCTLNEYFLISNFILITITNLGKDRSKNGEVLCFILIKI